MLTPRPLPSTARSSNKTDARLLDAAAWLERKPLMSSPIDSSWLSMAMALREVCSRSVPATTVLLNPRPPSRAATKCWLTNEPEMPFLCPWQEAFRLWLTSEASLLQSGVPNPEWPENNSRPHSVELLLRPQQQLLLLQCVRALSCEVPPCTEDRAIIDTITPLLPEGREKCTRLAPGGRVMGEFVSSVRLFVDSRCKWCKVKIVCLFLPATSLWDRVLKHLY